MLKYRSNLEDMERSGDSLAKRLMEVQRDLAQAKREEPNRIAAFGKALGLLAEAGPEGAQLAEGRAVIVRSGQFHEIAYGLPADQYEQVQVFHTWMGSCGTICIQAAEDAPDPDVLLTKLRLCQHDEATLWTVGNYSGYGEVRQFLPRQIQEWLQKDGPKLQQRRNRGPFAGQPEVAAAPPDAPHPQAGMAMEARDGGG